MNADDGWNVFKASPYAQTFLKRFDNAYDCLLTLDHLIRESGDENELRNRIKETALRLLAI